MKKIISLFLCFLLTFSISVFPVSATGNETSIEQMKESLISYGLLYNFVNSMSDLQIENLYNKIESGESEIKIIKEYATMDTEQSGVDTYGLINEDNFMLAVGVIATYGANNRINKAVGFVIWQWDGAHPAGRRDDLVHISWEPSNFTLTTENFCSVDGYTTHLGEFVEYNKATLPAKATTRDMVVYTDVYSGFGVDRGGWCVFTLLPAKPMYKGENYSTPIAVTYYHNKSMVPFINDFTYTDSGSGLGINFQDILTDTLASSFAFRYS